MLNLFTANVAFQTIVAIMTSPDYEPLKIPFDMSYLNPLIKSELERIYESLLLEYSHLESVNFLTIYIPMVELTCELKVVSKAFSTIFPCKSQVKKSKTFWIKSQNIIKRNVQYHSLILKELKSLEKLTKISFFLVYYMAMFFTAMSAIIIVRVQSFNISMVIMLVKVFNFMTECYVFCHLATEIDQVVRINRMFLKFIKFIKLFYRMQKPPKWLWIWNGLIICCILLNFPNRWGHPCWSSCSKPRSHLQSAAEGSSWCLETSKLLWWKMCTLWQRLCGISSMLTIKHHVPKNNFNWYLVQFP